jgi:hypothetical protein
MREWQSLLREKIKKTFSFMLEVDHNSRKLVVSIIIEK